MREAVEQLLLPAECALCHTLLSFPNAQRLVCDVCRHRWRQVRPPWCERCGQPEPHFGPCRACAAWPRALRAVRSAVWLEGGARDAVHALKYGGLPRIADDLADAMARLPLPEHASAWLVPVPLGPRRLRTRGYNQSAHLGRALARRWRHPVADLLVRVRDTATQTALTPDARLANVAEAFELQAAIRDPQSAIILVDDVFTTGATVAEAARALERAGARIILAVTFGRAVLPDFT
ncbi:MAG: ComF family protein [Gemmatimonadales bacterium]